jgi:hypothetical protein
MVNKLQFKTKETSLKYFIEKTKLSTYEEPSALELDYLMTLAIDPHLSKTIEAQREHYTSKKDYKK